MIKTLLGELTEEIKRIVLETDPEFDGKILFEVPKDEERGDYATNIALLLGKRLHRQPKVLAEELISAIDLQKFHLKQIETAGPGFINIRFDEKYLAGEVFHINKEGEHYGDSRLGGGEKILLEYVSVNPTGSLHIGHGRGAAYGDSLARILKKTGYDVTREHYVNDAGNQIDNLVTSIYQRYRELFGLGFSLGEDGYFGSEIIDIAVLIKEKNGDFYLHNDYHDAFRKIGLDYLLTGLKKDLKEFNVEFDNWFSERSLYDHHEVENTLRFLEEKGYTYNADNAVWLKTTLYGDDKDRVLMKSDGSFTYFTPDIAYHRNKLQRGYQRLIDVFGSDHHGYVNRLRASIGFIGANPECLEVKLLQMVRALRNGTELKMSKRSGKAITLRDLVDEVGTDALRFMYVSKSSDTHMDLDLDLALSETTDNPVYYVQYAHARITGLFRVLKESGEEFEEVSEFKCFDLKKADKLIKTLCRFPLYLETAALNRQPHRITQYTMILAQAFHTFYTEEKIITADRNEVNEKLTLLKAVQTVLKIALNLIGVRAVDRM